VEFHLEVDRFLPVDQADRLWRFGSPAGFTPEEAGKIAGGNYLQIFRAVVG
jgi:hypothetical protein